ncbi:CaiB/BaiF CoA transferase family protein [Muricoccus radiodurans]|uniref:CaiB/BaiF CoA transferase family protein n=1 Tax=Muricoccus radiodurans TaxID=2231721 RepID=UPI003CEBD49D
MDSLPPTKPLPLSGVRVIEFSHMVMGPTCGLVLADLGAEVIKVEPPGKGDRTRYLTSSGTGFFAAFSRNKRSVQLDTESDADRDALLRLIDTADVLIENFRPGGLEARGLGYAALSARNPRLIYLSLKGFLSGPYENRTALDEVVQMMSGLATMTGPPGRPLRAGAPVNDMMGGMFGAIAVLAALRQREMTGRGEHLQSGLFENAAFLVSTHMLQGAITGSPPPSMAAGRRAWGVYDVFTAADGVQLFIGVVTERQWEIFTRALGDPALMDPAWATNNARSAARETLIPLVQSLVGKRPVAELEAMCEAAGLPFARINHPGDLYDDPHLKASGGLLPVTLPDGRPAAVPALPIQFGASRLGVRSDLPAPGQHTHEILSSLPGDTTPPAADDDGKDHLPTAVAQG